MQSDGNLFSAYYLIKFQPQFKPLNQGLQSVLGWWITKCDKNGITKCVGCWITKCGKMDYKMR